MVNPNSPSSSPPSAAIAGFRRRLLRHRHARATVFRIPFGVVLLFFLFLTLGANDEEGSSFQNRNDEATKGDGTAQPAAVTRMLEDKMCGITEDEAEIGYALKLELSPRTPLHSTESQYQTIQVYDSPKHYGKVLVLDDCVQLTERDGDSYNEMMAHVAMMAHIKPPKRVLVIGGGDGYVVSEVLKHESVTQVDFVELDGEVIEVCKHYFPWGQYWSNDPRVTLHLTNGADFVARQTSLGYYDVIIQDSADPFYIDDTGELVTLPSEALFDPQHFVNLSKALTKEGVLVIQAETYNIPSSLRGIRSWRRSLLAEGTNGGLFASVRYGTIATSSYPTGQIGFLLCEKKINHADYSDNIVRIRERFTSLTRPTTYYHPRLQRSAFNLPLWVEQYIYGDEEVREGEEATN